MQLTALLRRAAFGLSLAASVGACSSVLGIESAECDSTRYPDCRPDSALCNTYCTAVMDACQNAVAQYVSYRNCLSVCGRLPPGNPGQTSGNNVQCRLAQANAAASIPDQEKVSTCAGAGPGGNGACGTVCESVCIVTMSACTGENEKFDGDLSACNASCNEANIFGASQMPPIDAPFTSTTSPLDMSKGNYQECRLWHACAASEAAFPHCDHTAGISTCK